MNKGWLRLMYLAILLLLMIVGWDFVLTSMGLRAEFTESLPTINNKLIPENLVTHLQKYQTAASDDETTTEQDSSQSSN